ncbi:MAG TPA: enoyl-CoA hydratase-related protein [Caulobacteraceae bacterium]|nr:enoyl-CoA hydratase-related protein [Caulobacteraceae bacterium]
MGNQPVKVQAAAPGVQLVTLTRPQVANAINTAMGESLLEIWTQVAADPSVRAVVMTGEGKAFCAGADLKERNGMTDQVWADQHLIFEAMARAQLSIAVPLIAAVNGAAMGGGAEMMLACDFALASPRARFGLPEAKLGFIPGLGGPALLARAVGERAALELLTSGRYIEAEEAVRLGLVSRICPAETLLDEALALAGQIAANAPLAVKALKRVVRAGVSMPLDRAMEMELSEYNRLFKTADRREGVASFNEKRPARFTGA